MLFEFWKIETACQFAELLDHHYSSKMKNQHKLTQAKMCNENEIGFWIFENTRIPDFAAIII